MEVAAAEVLHSGVHSFHSSDGLFSPPQDIFTFSQTILFPPFLSSIWWWGNGNTEVIFFL